MEIPDKALLEAICNSKDEEAFKVFYDRYAGLLHNWANRRTGNKELSDDIVQNFWIIFWSTPYKIKVDENGRARSYLMRYFSYRMIDYISTTSVQFPGSENAFDIENDTATYTHIFEELSVNEILGVLDRIVMGLPKIVREIFQFIWEEDHSVKEAAVHFEVSEKVIRTRYNKVLDIVQTEVKEMLNDKSGTKDPKALLKLIVLLSMLR